MTVKSNYYIIITRQYNDGLCHHYCKVELEGANEKTALERCKEFCNRFPKEEGWLIVLYYVDCSAQQLFRNN